VDEQVTRDFLCFGKPDATVVVVDATCLERNLNLVLQVLEITSKVVVCVNLLDEAKRKNILLDLAALAEELKVPVVGTVARDNVGLDQLVNTVTDVVNGRIKTTPYIVRYNSEIEEAIARIQPKIKQLVGTNFNNRWLALRLLDQDKTIIAALQKWLGEVQGEHELYQPKGDLKGCRTS
jgi:Fe2+ transport system protein B